MGDRADYAKAYYYRNRERRLAYQKAWRERNRQRVAELARKRYDPEKQRQYQQRYTERNKDKVAEIRRVASRKWYHANREKARAIHKEWTLRNAESILVKRRAYYQKNKALINGSRKAKRAANPQPDRDRERARHRSLKQRIVEALGGKCSVCNYDKNPHVLNIHHKGEKLGKQDWKKKDGMGRLPYLELLCANCHQERHHPAR